GGRGQAAAGGASGRGADRRPGERALPGGRGARVKVGRRSVGLCLLGLSPWIAVADATPAEARLVPQRGMAGIRLGMTRTAVRVGGVVELRPYMGRNSTQAAW